MSADNNSTLTGRPVQLNQFRGMARVSDAKCARQARNGRPFGQRTLDFEAAYCLQPRHREIRAGLLQAHGQSLELVQEQRFHGGRLAVKLDCGVAL